MVVIEGHTHGEERGGGGGGTLQREGKKTRLTLLFSRTCGRPDCKLVFLFPGLSRQSCAPVAKQSRCSTQPASLSSDARWTTELAVGQTAHRRRHFYAHPPPSAPRTGRRHVEPLGHGMVGWLCPIRYLPYCRVVHATLVAELGPCGALVPLNSRRALHDSVNLQCVCA